MTFDLTHLPDIFNAVLVILAALGVTSLPIMAILKSRSGRAASDVEDIARNIVQIINSKQLTIDEVNAIVADSKDLASALRDIYSAISAKKAATVPTPAPAPSGTVASPSSGTPS
ncbi:MAG: hypothetical protein KGH87_07160 [Thaumarchaeota archaeon]|nr:hypothetical protein [Nitrososphaerota archaeon]